MKHTRTLPLLRHFHILTDPRNHTQNTFCHPLENIIVIAIVAVVCGADNWIDIAKFGEARKSWFDQFLDLSHGIPSHDTFGRVFSILDPFVFEQCFSAWVSTIRKNGGVIAMDGKSARRSHTDNRPLHLINVLAVEQGVVLGQRTVDGKTNEITVLPELIDALFLEGCIVTTDAMGCQGWIAQKIIENKGEYVLAVKGNQGHLYDDIIRIFETESRDFRTDHTFVTLDHDHGRDERRDCVVSDRVDLIRERDKWTEVRSVAKVTCTRSINGIISTESRYFISSLAPNPSVILSAVRDHWKVESFHWSLDISFREDESRVRIGHAGENLALVRKIAWNLLSQERSASGGVKSRRLQAGWDEAYLNQVLGVV